MAKIKLITPITLDIDTGEETKSFPLKIKSLSKKERKEFSAFAEETKKAHEEMSETGKEYTAAQEAQHRIDEQLSTLDEMLSVTQMDTYTKEQKDERVALISEKMSLQKERAHIKAEIADLDTKLAGFKETIEEIQEDSMRKIYMLQTLSDGGLAQYIEETGIGYAVILEEVKRLVNEGNGKKSKD